MNDIKKLDDYASAATGLGGPPDKNQYSYFQRGRVLWEDELDSLYMSNAVAARIVDRLVDDATREGFTLAGADRSFDFSSIQSEIEDLKLLKIINKAWKCARLYGGSIIVLAVNDGKKYDERLDLDNITKLVGLRVIPAFRAIPDSYNYGMGSTSYLNPEFYLIQELNGKMKKIHSSRCIRIEGIPEISERVKLQINNGWGPSVLQRVFEVLQRLGTSEGYLANIVHEVSVLTLKMEGFNEMMCGGSDQKSQAQQMIENMKMLMDNLHVLILDSKDDLGETKRDVSGLSQVIDKFVDALVRSTDLPRTIILGEQPGGLNAGADGEIRGWFDHVHSQQKNFLTDIINQLLSIVFKIRENQGQEVPEEYNIEYVSLWQPSQNEQSDILLKNMQAYQLAVQNGFMTKDEVRSKLISSGIIEESGIEIAGVAEGSEINPVEQEELISDEEAMASTDPIPNDLISTKEAGAAVGVPTNTIHNMMKRGELKYWMFGSRKQVSLAEVLKAGKSHEL